MDNNSTPLVSVIIPAYNISPYLAECLDSILAQTYRNIEVIVAEDCSADGGATMAIAQSYHKAHPDRVRVVQTPTNSGAVAARTLGLKEADGDYIVFQDGDDTLHAEAIAKMLETAQRYNADIVKVECELLHSDGVITQRQSGQPIVFTDKEEIKQLARNLFSPPPTKHCVCGPSPSVWGALFRMELLRRHELFFPPIPHFLSEDIDFTFRAFRLATSVVYYPTSFYCYRYVDSSTTHKNCSDMLQRAVASAEYFEKTVREFDPDDDLSLMHARGYLIGCIISSCRAYLLGNADMAEKRCWFEQQRHHPIFKTLYETYPWRQMPLPRRLGFISFYKGRFAVMYAMLRGEQIVSRLLRPFSSRKTLS